MKTRLVRRCDFLPARPRNTSETQWQSFLAAREAVLDAGKPSTCPMRQASEHPEVMGWIRAAATADKTGVLLRAGGQEDQPARWLEAVQTVWSEHAAIDNEIADAGRTS